MERLEGCSEAGPDPDLGPDIVPLTEQFGGYGKTLTCPDGNVIVGTCGSGRYADCGNTF